LADQQITGAMQHQSRLLLNRFDRHKPHGRPGDCLANRFGIML
jgi:hypothetical protein